MELANDSTELVKKLKAGEIDVIAYQLSEAYCKKQGIATAGAHNKAGTQSWAALAQATDLVQALDDWYGDGVEIKAQKLEADWLKIVLWYIAKFVLLSSRAKKVLSLLTTIILNKQPHALDGIGN